MTNKILILTRDQEEFLEEVQKLNLRDAEVFAPLNDWDFSLHIKDADIILGNPPLISQYINQAQKVKWVQSTFAWIDALNNDSLKKDYTLTNVRDVYGPIISEYVFGYMLLFEKNILWNLDSQKKKIWDQKSYPSLVWKKIWIMGTGSIGLKIAEVAKVFWMEVYGYSTSQDNKSFIDKMFIKWDIGMFLEDLDYLVCVLPNTQDTKWIINRDVFSAMKKSSVFINVWRWANMHEDDCISAIKNKQIAGAILDVFQEEPLPQHSEFWDLENVFITPHISGNMSNIKSLLDIFTENYNRYYSGEELLYKIDFTKWY